MTTLHILHPIPGAKADGHPVLPGLTIATGKMLFPCKANPPQSPFFKGGSCSSSFSCEKKQENEL